MPSGIQSLMFVEKINIIEYKNNILPDSIKRIERFL